MSEDTVSIKVQIKNAAKAIADLGNIGKAVKHLSDQTDRSGRSVKTLGDYADHAYARMGRLGGTITQGVQTLARYSTYAAAAGAATTLMGLKTATGLEQTNVAFKHLLGSQELASTRIKELQQLAIDSPFQFTGLVKTSQTLLAMGFSSNELLKTVETIGDASAGLNQGQLGVEGIGRALGQINRKPKLSAEEMNQQLTEWGVDGWKYLAEESGKSVGELMNMAQQGMISGAEASRSILRGLDREFGGMMEKQSKTLGGRWNSLIDTIKSKLYFVEADDSETGVLAPLLILLRDNLPAVTVIAGKVMDRLGVGIANAVRGIRGLSVSFGVLHKSFQFGGMEQMLWVLGRMTGTGDTLWNVWKYLRDVSISLATIWKTSLYPAIQDLVTILGPVFIVSLKAVQAVLAWMADHPTAASAGFVALSAIIGTGALLLGLIKIVNIIRDITIAAKTAATFIGVMNAAAALSSAGAVPAIAATPAQRNKDGYWIGPGTPAQPGKPSYFNRAKSALKGGGILAGSLGASYVLGQYAKDHNEAWNFANPVPLFADGGFNARTQTAVVGERGPELVRLPGGSKVIPNNKLQNMVNQGNQQPQIVFQPGALTVNGADYVHTERLAKAVISEINTQIARR